MQINFLIREFLRFLLPKNTHDKLRKLRKKILSYFHKSKIKFNNDGGVVLKLPKNNFRSYVLQNDSRNHEVIKRRIINLLFKKNYIKNFNIIDAGSNCGDNSLPWALNLRNKKSKIFSIDPSSENINFILESCKLNQIKNLITIKHALSDKNDVKFEVSGDHDELFMIELKKIKKNSKKYGDIVISKTIDRLSKKFKFGKIGLFHIDAENFDYNILKGSKNLIKKNMPFIVCEIFLKSKNMNNICKLLKKIDYKLLLINEKCGNLPNVRNLLAIPPKIKFEEIYQDIIKNLSRENLENFKINKQDDLILKI